MRHRPLRYVTVTAALAALAVAGLAQAQSLPLPPIPVPIGPTGPTGGGGGGGGTGGGGTGGGGTGGGGGGGPVFPTARIGRDTTKPAITGLRVRSGSHRLSARFVLSEGAHVRVVITRGSKRVARFTSVVAAGRVSITTSTRRYRRGTYGVALTPVDYASNRGRAVKASAAVKRP